MYIGAFWSMHIGLRGATTGSGSALLRVFRDTGRERENGKLEKLLPGVYTPLHTNGKEKTGLQETLKACFNLLTR